MSPTRHPEHVSRPTADDRDPQLDGGAFCGPGDSGSLIVRKRDDAAVGLLFLEDQDTIIDGTDGRCTIGYAFDLQSQLMRFCGPGGRVTLA